MRYKRLIYLVLLAALTVRIVYALTLGEDIYWEDEFDYKALGQSLAEGRGYVAADGEPTAFRPVGYPLLLAALNLFGVRSVPAIRMAQALLGVVAVWLVCLLAGLLTTRPFAVLAASIAAFYPYFIFMGGTLFASTWFVVTFLPAVYLFMQGERRARNGFFVMSGLLMGLSTLSVTTAALTAPASLFWLLIKKEWSIRRVLRPAAVFTAAFFIVVSPWMVRNQRALGTASLSTNGGRNLWLGNNPAATVNSGSDIDMPPALQARIDAADEAEADRIYKEEALAFIRSRPQRFVTLLLLKGAALWRFDPSPTTDGYKVDQGRNRWLSVLSYVPVLLLAIIGFWRADRLQKKELLLWLLYFAVFTAVHAVYISNVRFRLPLDQFLIIMAALSVQKLFKNSTVFSKLQVHKKSIEL